MKASFRQMAKHAKQQRQSVGRQAPDDDGSALVLVLVLLTILSLALGAMFAEAGANLTTSTVVTGQDNKVYAADGGVEIAIQWLRGDTSGSLCTVSTGMPLGPAPVIDGLIVGLWCIPSGAYTTIRSTAPACVRCPPTSTAVVSIGPWPSRTVNIVSWVTVVHQ